MIKSYFVDGDKGGVGKSFVSRCLVDSFINHEVSGMPKIDRLIVIDADPMNPDVVCDNGYKNEVVNNIHVIGLQRPIKSEDDWLNLINELAETQINETDEIRLVFSLPSAAGACGASDLSVSSPSWRRRACVNRLICPSMTTWGPLSCCQPCSSSISRQVLSSTRKSYRGGPVNIKWSG